MSEDGETGEGAWNTLASGIVEWRSAGGDQVCGGEGAYAETQLNSIWPLLTSVTHNYQASMWVPIYDEERKKSCVYRIVPSSSQMHFVAVNPGRVTPQSKTAVRTCTYRRVGTCTTSLPISPGKVKD